MLTSLTENTESKKKQIIQTFIAEKYINILQTSEERMLTSLAENTESKKTDFVNIYSRKKIH